MSKSLTNQNNVIQLADVRRANDKIAAQKIDWVVQLCLSQARRFKKKNRPVFIEHFLKSIDQPVFSFCGPVDEIRKALRELGEAVSKPETNPTPGEPS